MEYTDGTPPTASQLAKDVCTFLKWTSEPEHDDRKRMLIKAVGYGFIAISISYYMYRFRWSTMKSRKLAFKPKS